MGAAARDAAAGDAPVRPAGTVVDWLAATRAVVGRPDAAAEVPCAGCTACCRSGQFVTIAADEADTLAHVPAALRFPAPGLPPGSVVLGVDEHGRCPLLGEAGCTIYAHRPRACRRYDCRVLALTGSPVDPTRRPLLAAAVARWRFEEPTEADRLGARAVRAAAELLDEQPELAAGTPAARGPGLERAVLAVALADLFVRRGEDGEPPALRRPDAEEVRVEVRRRAGPGGAGVSRPAGRAGR